MSTLKTNVALHAQGLSYGETSTSFLCPACGGGHRKKKSFAITRTPENMALYICYRATCGVKGCTSLSGAPRGANSLKAMRKAANPYTKPTRALNGEERQWWEFVFPTVYAGYIEKILYNEETRRYIMPIHNKYGGTIGHIARSFSGDIPKAITYWATRIQGSHHHTRRFKDSSTMIIVEDISSAEAISCVGVSAVALLGSHVDDELIRDLHNDGYNRIIIALDADAWEKGEKYADKFRLLGTRSLRWASELDPKDMSNEELVEVFSPFID